MNLIDAIKSGRALRRKGHSFSYTCLWSHGAVTHIAPGTWMEPTWFLSTVFLRPEDITAIDWEVRPVAVPLTWNQFWDAAYIAHGTFRISDAAKTHYEIMAKELGLEP